MRKIEVYRIESSLGFTVEISKTVFDAFVNSLKSVKRDDWFIASTEFAMDDLPRYFCQTIHKRVPGTVKL